MSVIDIDLAMRHLLAEPEDQVLIQAQLDAAEDAAAKFMQRRFFLDGAALVAAQAQVSARMLQARTTLNQALDDLALVGDCHDRDLLRSQAQQVWRDTQADINAAACGILLNASITAACLLKLGHLFANREEVVTGVSAVELPIASQSLLMPYRIGMGV